MTSMDSGSAVTDPQLLLAVTVYVVFGLRTRDAPETWPVAESNTRPAGKEGLIFHKVTVPWVSVGDMGVTGTLTVPM